MYSETTTRSNGIHDSREGIKNERKNDRIEG